MTLKPKSLRAVARQWPRVLAESLRPAPERAAAAVAEADRPAPESFDLSAWEASDLAACWIGHATCLLRAGGRTILTDPHFGHAAGPRLGRYHVGRRRTTELPMDVDDLPHVDVLLLSHAHFDHWDRPSLARLARRFGSVRHRPLTVVVPPRTRRLLPHGFRHVVELGWEREAEVGPLRLGALRPKHWGARWVFDRRRGYNAYVIEAANRRILFGGDTAHTTAFDVLASRGGVDLAILGIGTYRNWEHLHATPEQAAAMARAMNARLLLPIHHSTFPLDDEPRDEPLERLRCVWNPERLVCTQPGAAWFPSPA